MQITRRRLVKLEQTIGEMKRLAWTYRNDVAEYATMPLTEFYEMVKNIPYKKDPDNKEVLKRPLYTLKAIGPGGDCDDKAIVMMAWCYLNHIPFRIKVVGKYARKNLHHVVLELYYNGDWHHVDATYPHNSLGRPLYEYQRERTF